MVRNEVRRLNVWTLSFGNPESVRLAKVVNTVFMVLKSKEGSEDAESIGDWTTADPGTEKDDRSKPERKAELQKVKEEKEA